jgi:class 3 adenylate cyclase
MTEPATANPHIIAPPPLASPVGKALFWFAVVAVPLLFLVYSLRSVLDEIERSMRQTLQREMQEEMGTLLEDARAEIPLGRFLLKVRRSLQGWVQRRARRRLPVELPLTEMVRNLRQSTRRHLQAEPLLIMACNGSFTETVVFGHPSYYSPIAVPSRVVSREILRFIRDTDRARSASLRGGAGIPKNSASDERLKKMRGQLQGLFGNYISPDFPLDQVKRTYTNRFGGGVLYLFPFVVPAPGGDQGSPTAIILVAFLDSMLPLERRIELALQGSGNSKFQRSLLILGRKMTGGFTEKNGTLRYDSMVPFPLASHAGPGEIPLIERLPAPLARGKRFIYPFLRVSCPLSSVRHPLRAFMPGIQAAVALTLFGTFLFMVTEMRTGRLFLRLREKVVLAVILSITVPIAAFWMSATAYFHFKGKLDVSQNLESMAQKLELFEQGLVGMESAIQSQVLNLGHELGRHVEHEPDLRQAIRRIGDLGFVRWTAFIRNDGLQIRENFLTLSDDAAKEKRFQEEIQSNMLSWMKLKLTERGGCNERYYTDRGLQPPRDADISMKKKDWGDEQDMKRMEGMMMRARLPNLENVGFAFVFVTDPKTHRAGKPLFPRGMMCVMFSLTHVTQKFVRDLYQDQTIFTDSNRDYSFLYNVYAYDEQRRSLQPQQDIEAVFPSRKGMSALARRVLTRGKNGAWNHLANSPARLTACRIFQSYPCLAVATAVPASATSSQPSLTRFLVNVFAYTVLIVILIFTCLSEMLIQPFRLFLHGIQEIRAENLGFQLPQRFSDEFSHLFRAFNQMSAGLLERQKMERFVSRRVLDAVAGKADDAGSREATISDGAILVSDIRGFTRLSEQHPPQDIVQMLNAYFTEMEQAIQAHGGFIDKFVGDAIIGVFLAPAGAGESPVSTGAPAEAAVRAALAMRSGLAAFNAGRRQRGEFEVENGIAIAGGPIISGQVRSGLSRKELGVYGKTIETAQALEPLSKFGCFSRIVVAADLAGQVRDIVTLEPLSVPGLTDPGYEIRGDPRA